MSDRRQPPDGEQPSPPQQQEPHPLGEDRREFVDRSRRSTHPSSARKPAAQRARSLTVLLVEDELGIQRSLVRILNADGFDVVTMRDGEDALGYLRENEAPALILLDLSMPRLNGYQFRVRQLGDQRIAQIPVIILSGEYDTPDVQRLGAVSCIPKPFDTFALLDEVRRATGVLGA